MKMSEMKIVPSEKYHIVACIHYPQILILDFDSGAMINLHTKERGVFDVKPLGVIWGLFPEFYNASNTIMVYTNNKANFSLMI